MLWRVYPAPLSNGKQLGDYGTKYVSSVSVKAPAYCVV
jgi:hypothetical protein